MNIDKISDKQIPINRIILWKKSCDYNLLYDNIIFRLCHDEWISYSSIKNNL